MTHWDEAIDIAVVGSGAAGLAAAFEARKAGARVTVFEKMNIPGGNTRISDGALSAAGNFLQKQRHVEDSVDLFVQDLYRAGLGWNHPDLVRVFAERAAEAIDWTRDTLEVRYLDRLDRFGGHSVARSVTTRSHCGAVIVRNLQAQIEAQGVAIRRRCCLQRIETDAKGAVTGMVVSQGYRYPDARSGTRRRIRVGRAVVLATGGFAGDIRFRRMLQPALDESIATTNQKGSTAEGMVAALRIGALPVHLSCIQLAPWACPDEKGFGKAGRFASYAVFPAGILVDPRTGGRIVNEWADRRERADAMLRAGGPCVGIVDARGAANDPESLRIGLRSGKIRAFDTVVGLAETYEMPPASLERTIEDYNRRMHEVRRDPFGKRSSGREAGIVAPPFYALRLWPKAHYTPGGIGITPKAEVLDLDGRIIPGLYAAGEVCGGVHGAGRLGGCALAECLVFGRIAGVEARRHGAAISASAS